MSLGGGCTALCMGWVERLGLSCQNALNCILPRTINPCNLHLNELDSLNLALLKWVKGHGTSIISIISWGVQP